MIRVSKALATLAMLAATTLAAHAGVNKTWVSGTGSDAGTCTYAAPCATFNYAIGQTNAGGEIDVKDAGGYGTFTINKSISIVADGVLAGINVPQGQTGITVYAGSADKVVIRGLTIDGHNVGSEGLEMILAGTLVIEKCTISNMSTIGLVFRNNGIVFLKSNLITGSHLGIFVYEFNNSVYIGDNVVTANAEGLQDTFNSFGDNYIRGNTSCDVCSANLQSVARQ